MCVRVFRINKKFFINLSGCRESNKIKGGGEKKEENNLTESPRGLNNNLIVVPGWLRGWLKIVAQFFTARR